MAFPLPDVGRAGLVRLAAVLLSAGALWQGGRAQAQGFMPLPKASEAIPAKLLSAEQLFRVESEDAFRRRLREEARRAKAPPPIFPTEPAPESHFGGRAWHQSVAYAEPSYVCYYPLYFQQINSERYGGDLGAILPLVSLGIFYFDAATLPYKLAAAGCRPECSAGYCLPGDPTPLLLYPPQCSAAGTLAEASAIGALFLLFP